MVQLDKPALLIGVLAASLVAYLVRLVFQWRRLSHVPGPFWASLSRGWMVVHSIKGCQPTSFKHVNDIYGTALMPMLTRQPSDPSRFLPC
jgi:hypothetical protein